MSSKCRPSNTMTRHTTSTPLSIFSPSGALIRLSDSVDSSISYVANTCAQSNIVVSGVCTIALSLPLRLCRSVLQVFEHLLGVKHRAILIAQRKKSRNSLRKSEHYEGDDSVITNEFGSPSTARLRNKVAGVKFDLENSPGAAKLLNLVSPGKRRASASECEEEEIGTSFEDSSTDQIDHYNLLDASDNYKSEDDPDFEITSDLLEKEKQDLECAPSFAESDNELLEFRRQEATSKDDDMIELAYDDMDLHLGECKTAKLCDNTECSPFVPSKAVLGKTTPLKSVENTVRDNNDWDGNEEVIPVVKLNKLSRDTVNKHDQSLTTEIENQH